MNTPEQREYWVAVKKIADEVNSWPAWLRGVNEPKTLTPKEKQEPVSKGP